MEKERSTEGERDWAVHATLRREVTTLPGGGLGCREERGKRKKSEGRVKRGKEGETDDRSSGVEG